MRPQLVEHNFLLSWYGGSTIQHAKNCSFTDQKMQSIRTGDGTGPAWLLAFVGHAAVAAPTLRR